MAKVRLDVGATVDFLNKDELDDSLAKDRAAAAIAVAEQNQGVKYMRLPVLYATPSSGTVVLGQAWAGQVHRAGHRT